MPEDTKGKKEAESKDVEMKDADEKKDKEGKDAKKEKEEPPPKTPRTRLKQFLRSLYIAFNGGKSWFLSQAHLYYIYGYLPYIIIAYDRNA